MRKDWAGNAIDNDIIYCGTLSDGHIKIYKNLDKASAKSIARYITKCEYRTDRFYRGLQVLEIYGKDFLM